VNGSVPALRPVEAWPMAEAAPDTHTYATDPYGARPPLRLSLAELLMTLRLRWPWLLLALALPAALGLVAAAGLKPRYTAESVVMVLVNRDSTAAQDISGIGPAVVSIEILRVVRGEIEILMSDAVVGRTLDQVGIGTLFPDLVVPAEGQERQAATDAFRRIASAEADAGSNILRARVALPDRALAIRALSAWVDSYTDRRAEMYSDGNARLLAGELARYEERLRANEAEISALRNRYGVLDMVQEMALAATRLDGVQQRLDRSREQQVSAEAQLAAARAALQAQPGRVFASQDATNLAPNDDSRNQLARLLQERDRLGRQYTADYPLLQELDQRIATARAAVRESTRSTFQTVREVRNPAVEALTQRVLALETDSASAGRQADELERQRAEAEARRAELVQADARLRELQRAREGMEAVSRQLTTREAATRIEADARRQAGTDITLVQPATAPLEGRSIKRLVAIGGIAAGLALFAGLALLLTLTRRSFATPREAERGLALPALASLGDLAPAARDLKRLPEVSDLVAMLRDARVGHRRPCLVQVVSAGGRDDRAALARAVALEYARRTDTDTLLIDLETDGRAHLAALGSRPLAVEDRAPGNVLVFSTVVPHLWVAYDAAASHLTDPMATQEQTVGLLTQLRGAFDAVVLLAPPGDESYPMRRLTALVDVNLIVVQGERTAGGAARGLRDWVLGAGGTLLGFVFTGRRRIRPAFLGRMS
jgi:uncharacterized protein involved in exopolysaccharide biosynthesis/Mrp family chromosome partitioning ATPase